MGQSTRQSVYHAVLILIISIENHILCESSSEEDSAEFLETIFDVLPYVKNDSPNDKLINTLLTLAAAKAILPEVYSATRPVWPQRPPKLTQIQDLMISSKPQQPLFNPSTSILQSRSPILFPETNSFDQHQNFITPQEHNPVLQSNGIDRRFVLVDPSQNNFESDNPIVLQGDATNINLSNNGNNHHHPSSGSFQGSSPSVSVTQYPIFMATPENNVISPSIFPASPSNMLPINGVIMNPSQGTCQCDEPQVVTLTKIFDGNPDVNSKSDNPVVQSNQVQHVPYNLEINLPVLTRIIPTSDSGFLFPESFPQICSGPTLPPFMNYPPFLLPPPPMPFLPPIVIQGSKSKSKDLLKIFLISQLLPFGFMGGNNCGCEDTHYIPVPCPTPFPTNK